MKFRIFAKSRAAFPGMTAACAGNYVIATDARMISFGLDVTNPLLSYFPIFPLSYKIQGKSSQSTSVFRLRTSDFGLPTSDF